MIESITKLPKKLPKKLLKAAILPAPPPHSKCHE